MNSKKKYLCPCCGNYTLDESPPGTFNICPICYWEDDNIQYANPNYRGGANDISLNEARENYKKIGVISEKYLDKVKLSINKKTYANIKLTRVFDKIFFKEKLIDKFKKVLPE